MVTTSARRLWLRREATIVILAPESEYGMAKPLQIYDVVISGAATRMVHGVIIEDEHTCWHHSIPCKTIVYLLSVTSDHSEINTAWCEIEMKINGYRKMTKRDAKTDIIKYKPYTTDIPDEPHFTHIYSLKLQNGKWFVGLTANLRDDLDAHRVGKKHWWTAENPMIEVDKTYDFDKPTPEHEAVVPAIMLRTDLYEKYGMENVKSNIRFKKTERYRRYY